MRTELLTRLEAAGMPLEVQYLGHCITSEGVFPTEEKMSSS